MFESDANSFHKCKITFQLTYMPRLILLPFKAHEEYSQSVLLTCHGKRVKKWKFSTHKWVTTGWWLIYIYAQQTIMISCVMGEMRVKIIIHLHLPNDSFIKDEQKIKNHKKKSAKNEKMRRWNVGRREKWNCHLSIIIIIISIILWRSWIRFACERVSARYNKIMKFLLAVIEPHSELCSSNYWQTKKRVYMSDHNPLHVIFHTWVTFLTELIMYLKKEIGHDGRRRNWELGHPMHNVMQFFSPLQRRKEKVQMHTQKKHWRHVVMIAICLQKERKKCWQIAGL